MASASAFSLNISSFSFCSLSHRFFDHFSLTGSRGGPCLDGAAVGAALRLAGAFRKTGSGFFSLSGAGCGLLAWLAGEGPLQGDTSF